MAEKMGGNASDITKEEKGNAGSKRTCGGNLEVYQRSSRVKSVKWPPPAQDPKETEEESDSEEESVDSYSYDSSPDISCDLWKIFRR